MPSLKDIRIRINSVKTTRQVTSAMKMVSAAKFKKAQDDISHIRPYVDRLAGIIFNLSSTLDEKIDFEWSTQRGSHKILLIVIASNRGLCGGFNSNVIKETERIIKTQYTDQYKSGDLDIYTIGKQAQKVLKSRGYPVLKEYNDLYTNVTYEAVKNIALEIMSSFLDGVYDDVVLVYNEFKNAAVHEVKAEQFLPLQFPEASHTDAFIHDYIVEPDSVSFIKQVIPDALQTMFYRVILESIASEHGARMTSMHKATDNATELLDELQLVYNKARQTAITTEILEIVGGAEALKK
nr:ATP synthase F1 subunit gamma [uncultured Carboxylicivirga sp.]